MLSDTLNDCMCVHAHSMKDGKAVFPSELFEEEEDGAPPRVPPALAPPTPLKPKPEEEEDLDMDEFGEEEDGDVLMGDTFADDEDHSDGLGTMGESEDEPEL